MLVSISPFPSVACRGGTLQDAVMSHIEGYVQAIYLTTTWGSSLSKADDDQLKHNMHYPAAAIMCSDASHFT